MFSFFPLSIGLLGSLHCLGMCGPLVLAYSLHLQSQSGTATKFSTFPARLGLFHHIAFHIGRLTTYGILGALAAGLFQAVDLTRIFFSLRSGMSYIAGLLLVFLGLMLLRAIPLPAFLTSVSLGPGSFFGRCFPPLFRSQTVLSKLLLGMATGLIPCCLSWAMIVTAASTQNPMQGFITMVLFGTGTVPALFFTGLSASFLSWKVRFLGEKVAAVSIIFMGIALILQGAEIIA